MEIATTPPPPYYAVIFSSVRRLAEKGYTQMSEKMFHLASEQDGFLGFESARETIGISVSYWKDLDSIKAWKDNLEHREAQRLGREKWYSDFVIRVAKVERAYGMAIQPEKKTPKREFQGGSPD
jgi:heme-degrading monooxygenase HmoA